MSAEATVSISRGEASSSAAAQTQVWRQVVQIWKLDSHFAPIQVVLFPPQGEAVLNLRTNYAFTKFLDFVLS